MTSESSPAAATPPKPNKEKPAPPNVVIPPSRPKLSKAERRAMQEQQRADKAARTGGGGGTTNNKAAAAASAVEKSPAKVEPKRVSETAISSSAVTPSATSNSNEPIQPTTTAVKDTISISLVSHLAPFQDSSRVFRLIGPTLQLQPSALPAGEASASTITSSALHPAVLQLGLDYASLKIRGGNARCRAMLHCFATLLQDYQPPPTTKDLRQALLHDVLNSAFSFWTHSCRPHSVSMGNAFSFVKHAVASLDRTTTTTTVMDSWATTHRTVLLETLQQYERERLDYAGVAIADWAVSLLLPPPSQRQQQQQQDNKEIVLLTFGHSEAVLVVLQQLAAAQQESSSRHNKQPLRVIVVDSRPSRSGKQMLKSLSRAGISCTYVLLNALSYVLQDVTKVILGASALMSDGSVLAQIGTACVALAARTAHIPVLVCCETYKISNKLYLESITHNELGSPSALNDPTSDGSDGDVTSDNNTAAVKKLHLMYDLTPASFVSGIVTELGIVPATSVAVLLREMTPQEYKYED